MNSQKMKMIKISVDLSYEVVEIDKPLNLNELYRILSCELIETAPTLFSNILLIVDEEGLLVNKAFNLLASAFYGSTMNYIAGDALICTIGIDENGESDLFGLNQEQIDCAIKYIEIVLSKI